MSLRVSLFQKFFSHSSSKRFQFLLLAIALVQHDSRLAGLRKEAIRTDERILIITGNITQKYSEKYLKIQII